MRLQLLRIDREDGLLDLVWSIGRQQYARTVKAVDVNTPAKLGAYILSQVDEVENEQLYIVEAHRENGDWVLDHFTGDNDRDAGRVALRQLPGWASWTAQEADDWIVTNVTDLASAKTALRAMARMLIYLRNSTQ